MPTPPNIEREHTADANYDFGRGTITIGDQIFRTGAKDAIEKADLRLTTARNAEILINTEITSSTGHLKSAEIANSIYSTRVRIAGREEANHEGTRVRDLYDSSKLLKTLAVDMHKKMVEDAKENHKAGKTSTDDISGLTGKDGLVIGKEEMMVEAVYTALQQMAVREIPATGAEYNINRQEKETAIKILQGDMTADEAAKAVEAMFMRGLDYETTIVVTPPNQFPTDRPSVRQENFAYWMELTLARSFSGSGRALRHNADVTRHAFRNLSTATNQFQDDLPVNNAPEAPLPPPPVTPPPGPTPEPTPDPTTPEPGPTTPDGATPPGGRETPPPPPATPEGDKEPEKDKPSNKVLGCLFSAASKVGAVGILWGATKQWSDAWKDRNENANVVDADARKKETLQEWLLRAGTTNAVFVGSAIFTLWQIDRLERSGKLSEAALNTAQTSVAGIAALYGVYNAYRWFTNRGESGAPAAAETTDAQPAATADAGTEAGAAAQPENGTIPPNKDFVNTARKFVIEFARQVEIGLAEVQSHDTGDDEYEAKPWVSRLRQMQTGARDRQIEANSIDKVTTLVRAGLTFGKSVVSELMPDNDKAKFVVNLLGQIAARTDSLSESVEVPNKWIRYLIEMGIQMGHSENSAQKRAGMTFLALFEMLTSTGEGKTSTEQAEAAAAKEEDLKNPAPEKVINIMFKNKVSWDAEPEEIIELLRKEGYPVADDFDPFKTAEGEDN